MRNPIELIIDYIIQVFSPGTIDALLGKREWATLLFKLIRLQKTRLRESLNNLNAITFGDPLDLAKRYIEPYCQEINPANREEDDFLVSREPAFRKLSQFFSSPTRQLGSNQLFVLSDAGMGKTSLLAMLKLMHLNKIWPTRLGCEIFKLAPDTLELLEKRINSHDRLQDHISPQNTILLLDSLDEDPSAYGRTESRVLEILSATQRFFKVIITCRTQFFPVVQTDPLERPGMVVIGGFTCPTKYLANFSDELVEKYLAKVFPITLRFVKRMRIIHRARATVHAMGSLRCRPMLLAHIEDLIESPVIQNQIVHSDPTIGQTFKMIFSGWADTTTSTIRLSEFVIYKALVTSWLNREQAKHGIDANKLLLASEGIASLMMQTGKRSVSHEELSALVSHVPEAQTIEIMELEGRSLLNKTSEGYFRFSHFSIQEYLVVQALVGNRLRHEGKRIQGTGFMASLIFDLMFSPSGNSTQIDLSNITFEGADLRNSSFVARDFPNLKIKGIIFDSADFSRSKLSGAILEDCAFRNCRFDGAILSGAVMINCDFVAASFREAKLRNCSFDKCNLEQVDLMLADLSGGSLTECTFKGASNLGWCCLRGCALRRCSLASSDWSGPNYRNLSPGEWWLFDGADVQFLGRLSLHCSSREIGSIECCSVSDLLNASEELCLLLQRKPQ